MDKQALIKALRDTAQSASNAIASNVSGPVDLLAAGLRMGGLNVNNPVGGSQWMQERGLTREVEMGAPRIVGETLGMAGPALATQFAPKIAGALNQGGANIAHPTTLNKQSGMILYHGSNDSKPLKQINDEGLFGGLFTSPSDRSAASHGDSLYRMTIPDQSIMNVGDELPWDLVQGVIGKNIRKDSPYLDDISDMVVNAKSAFDSPIPEDDLLSALRSSDLGEADWEIQRLRGLLGKSAGYKAVQMPDEHGMSYLVLPGTKPRPANESSKKLFRNK